MKGKFKLIKVERLFSVFSFLSGSFKVLVYALAVLAFFDVCSAKAPLAKSKSVRVDKRAPKKSNAREKIDQRKKDSLEEKKKELAERISNDSSLKDNDSVLESIIGDDGHLKLASTKQEEEEERNISFNFENSDLTNFINYMAEARKLNIIPSKETQAAKISLNVREPLSISQAWEVFLTVLEMANFSLVKVGQVFKVIRQDIKKTEPLPAYINVAADDLPDSDKTIRFVTFLRNIPAGDVEQLIRGMLGKGGDLIRQDTVNGFIITDKCFNIKSTMKVINELDTTGLQEMVFVVRLEKSEARDVKKLLDDLIRKPQDGNPIARLLGKQGESSTEYFSPTTKIIVEERTNSLILLGNQRSIQKVRDFIAEYIEQDNLQSVESPFHIYECQYSDAEQLKFILEEIVNTSSETGADKYGGIRGGGKYLKKMRFDVDKVGNRLLVSCTDKQDWKLLKKVIQDMDKPQPQVALETLIVDINMDKIDELGSQIRTKENFKRVPIVNPTGTNNVRFTEAEALEYERNTGNSGFEDIMTGISPFKNVIVQSGMLGGIIKRDGGTGTANLLGDLASLFSGSPGTAILSLGRTLAEYAFNGVMGTHGGVWALLKMIKTQTSTSVVANPFITLANRNEGTIKVGESRRIAKESFTGYTEKATSYESRSADTEIRFKPQINSEGLINLSINVTVDEFSDTKGGATTNKKLETKVTVANGQVLVLGGFVKTSAKESRYQFPFLSNLPVLGWLFKNKRRQGVKVYTFIFVSPSIIKPRQTPGSGLYTKMKLHNAEKGIRDSVETDWGPDVIHNWFFNPDKENYHHKVVDYANARYQPTIVDIANDPYYRAHTKRGKEKAAHLFKGKKSERPTQEIWSSSKRNLDDKKTEASKKTEQLGASIKILPKVDAEKPSGSKVHMVENKVEKVADLVEASEWPSVAEGSESDEIMLQVEPEDSWPTEDSPVKTTAKSTERKSPEERRLALKSLLKDGAGDSQEAERLSSRSGGRNQLKRLLEDETQLGKIKDDGSVDKRAGLKNLISNGSVNVSKASSLGDKRKAMRKMLEDVEEMDANYDLQETKSDPLSSKRQKLKDLISQVSIEENSELGYSNDSSQVEGLC